MKRNSLKDLEKSLQNADPMDILAIAESLYKRAKEEIAAGKQYSQADIAKINNARKAFARARKRLYPGGVDGPDRT